MSRYKVDTDALAGAGSAISNLTGTMPDDTTVSASGCGNADVEDAVADIAFWGTVLWSKAEASLNGLALSTASAAQQYARADEQSARTTKYAPQ